MITLFKWITLGAFFALMFAAFPSSEAATLDPLVEYRYINHAAGEVIKRDAKGEIIRRADVIAAFKKIHPCPSTGLYKGACPNWQLQHVSPLACGGIDAVSNLMWVHVSIKTGASATCPYCLDRVERKINALTPPIPDTAKCVNQIIK